MELTPSTKARGRQAGWSDELLARIEASPMKDATAANLALMKLPGDRVDGFVALVERDDRFTNVNLKFIRTRAERGLRAKPGEHGLGTPEINIGTYGQVPDRYQYENDTPLGSHADPDNYVPGSYHIYDKVEVWAEGVDQLYEEAIRNRWVPATDLDWNNSLKELPEEVERAYGQLATIYSSHGLVEQKILAKWLEPISYGYHDVKLFLGTQIYDCGHKVEALRKRALANGGGLGRSPLGTLYRSWYGALKFTELVTAVHVVFKSYETTLFAAGAEFAKTDVERRMYELIHRDSVRHLEYGKRHLLWYLQNHPRGQRNISNWLARGEAGLSNELRHSHAEREALVVLFADGMEKLSTGVEKLRDLRQRQLSNYLALLDELGIDRPPQLNVGLAKVAEDPLAV